MMSSQCPQCHKPFVRRSQRVGVIEYLLSVIYVYPFRCQVCTHRFLTWQWGKRYHKQQVDRRQYDRLSTHLPATFRSDGHQGEGVVVTISMDGCSLQTELYLPEGTLLRLQLQLPGTTPPVNIEVAIVRSVYPTVIGLQFLRLQASDEERLGHFVQRLLEAYRA